MMNTLLSRSAFLLTVCIFLAASDRGESAAEIKSNSRPVSQPTTRAIPEQRDILKLLDECLIDDGFSSAARRRIRQYRYAQARLIMMGSPGYDALAKLIATDIDLNPDRLECALATLLDGNDVRAIRLTCAAAAHKSISNDVAVILLSKRFPLYCIPGIDDGVGREQRMLAWITDRLDDHNSSSILLVFLDLASSQAPKDEFGRYLLRYLNRIDNYDIDEWLSAVDVKCHELRQRHLRNGVDITGPLLNIGREAESSGELSNFYDAIELPPDDRAIYTKIIRASKSLGFGKTNAEWRHLATMAPTSDLVKWFRENRNSFIYDSSLKRLVIRQEKQEGKR